VRKFSAKSRTRTRAIIKTVFSIPYRIIGFRFFLKRLDSLSATFDYDSSEYVGILCFGEGPKERLHKSRIEKPSLVLFEGEYYNAPSDCDYYLTNMYGNYWELPPENARVSKHMNKSYWKKTHEVRESNGEMNQKDKKEEKGH